MRRIPTRCKFEKYKFRWVSIILLLGPFLTACQAISNESILLKNPDLPSVREDYPGNLFSNGKFVERYSSVSSGGESLWNYATWKLNPFREHSVQHTFSNTPVIPYVPNLQANNPHISWLGHSTVLIKLNNETILVDPILGTPRLFHGSRLVDSPVTPDKLTVDYLLATHGHRDHLDKKTVKNLGAKSMKAFVPLKMGSKLRKWRPEIKVVEGGWYQTYTTDRGLEITLLPALHWSRRSVFDTNATLWGSYLISDGKTKIYIAGDTGYGAHFKEIATLFSNIDYAILPIGSYEPVQVQHNSHMTPEEAIVAFQDLGAKIVIPVHFGTYDLSDEPIDEPLERFKREIQRQEVPPDSIRILDIGEVLDLS